jgi:hypothetical protein
MRVEVDDLVVSMQRGDEWRDAGVVKAAAVHGGGGAVGRPHHRRVLECGCSE